MKTDQPNTTRVGLSLALLSMLALLTVVSLRLQAADNDNLNAAKHCAMQATAGKSCCAPAASQPMNCGAMHGGSSDSTTEAAPHHH